MRTPIRDQLGLNDPEFQSAEATRREMRAREAAEKDSLRSGLAGLPAPKNEYQIMVPEVCEAVLLGRPLRVYVHIIWYTGNSWNCSRLKFCHGACHAGVCTAPVIFQQVHKI